MNKLFPILSIAVFISLLLIGNTYLAYGKPKATDDLSTLLLSGNEPFSDSPTITMSYFGYYKEAAGTDDFMEKGALLSEILNLPVGYVENNNSPVYTVKFEHDQQILISLYLTDNPNHTSTALSLTLQSSNPSAIPAMKTMKAQMDKKLSQVTSDPQWNTVLQGEFAGSTDELIDTFSKEFGLAELNRYTDTGTLSISYHSEMDSSISSPGDKETNFQIAIHRNSQTDRTRLTIGTPAINIEY